MLSMIWRIMQIVTTASENEGGRVQVDFAVHNDHRRTWLKWNQLLWANLLDTSRRGMLHTFILIQNSLKSDLINKDRQDHWK